MKLEILGLCVAAALLSSCGKFTNEREVREVRYEIGFELQTPSGKLIAIEPVSAKITSVARGFGCNVGEMVFCDKTGDLQILAKSPVLEVNNGAIILLINSTNGYWTSRNLNAIQEHLKSKNSVNLFVDESCVTDCDVTKTDPIAWADPGGMIPALAYFSNTKNSESGEIVKPNKVGEKIGKGYRLERIVIYGNYLNPPKSNHKSVDGVMPWVFNLKTLEQGSMPDEEWLLQNRDSYLLEKR